jgi:hypothetical protein
MKKEYSYTTDEVPAKLLAGTIDYDAKDDVLVIFINKKFMRITN